MNKNDHVAQRKHPTFKSLLSATIIALSMYSCEPLYTNLSPLHTGEILEVIKHDNWYISVTYVIDWQEYMASFTHKELWKLVLESGGAVLCNDWKINLGQTQAMQTSMKNWSSSNAEDFMSKTWIWWVHWL